jgi:tRNA threonylcarbamoyl adenosine modification protein YeaZ
VARALSLVLDLSAAGFAAVAEGEKTLASRWKPPEARHDALGDWVEDCLREAGAHYPDIGEVYVGIGPGSFTGIRIAMAFAQGLALPHSLPVHGFTAFVPLLVSLESGAQGRVAAIPANAGRFYAAHGLDDAGTLLESESLRAFGAMGRDLVVPADVPALDAVRTAFRKVTALNQNWDVAAVMRQARASGRGAAKPHYLAPSAAEAKAGISNPSHGG